MIEKAHAKVNIFLKIVGTRENYHLLSSRFRLISDLYDTVLFHEKSSDNSVFTLDGDFSCPLEQNSIYKAYKALRTTSDPIKIDAFFRRYKVVVKKNIPEFAGLGGGSSDAAAFLRLSNRILKLNLSTKLLAEIGGSIGADVPFFIYEYSSANVSGIGEIVRPYEEDKIDIATYTPNIACDTSKVYQQFREAYISNIELSKVSSLEKTPSTILLKEFDAYFLNDLFQPALDLYPKLANYYDKHHFFSGSGSTFFRITDG